MRLTAVSLVLLLLPARGSESLRVIEAQNKVAAAHYLSGLGFSIPAPMIQKLVEEEADALRAVRDGAALGLKEIDAQIEELKRVNAQKNEEAQKILVGTAKRLVKDSVKLGEILAGVHKADVNREKAIGQGILSLVRDAEGLGPSAVSAIAVTYGGDRARLIRTGAELRKSLVEIETRRDGLACQLGFLKEVKGLLEAGEAIADPQAEMLKRLEKAAVTYAVPHYDEATRKYLGDLLSKVREEAVGAATQIRAIDASTDVRIPEETKRMCKGLAVVAAVLKSVSSAIKESQMAGPVESFLEIVDYYAEAFSIVWTVAETMGKLMEKRDQGYVGWYGTSVWKKMNDREGEIEIDPEAARFGVKLAAAVGKPGRYYLVTTEPDYEVIDGAARDRLVQALADERIVNATYEATEGLVGWAWRKLTPRTLTDMVEGLSDAQGFNENDVKAYESRLREASRKSPLDGRSLSALASGTQGYFAIRGKRQSADGKRLAELRDEAIAEQGIREFIRGAMAAPDVTREWRKAYSTFFEAVVRSDANFSRTQLQNLFNSFVRSGCDLERLAKLLEKVKSRQQGNDLVLGVPELRVGVKDEAGRASSTLVEADVVVDGLPIGADVEATIRWQFPDWAGGTKPEQVRVRNGVVVFKGTLTVPETVEGGSYQAAFTIEAVVPSGDKRSARGEVPFKIIAKADYQLHRGGGSGLYLTVELTDDLYLPPQESVAQGEKNPAAFGARVQESKKRHAELLRRTKGKNWFQLTVRFAGKTYTAYSKMQDSVGSYARFSVSLDAPRPGGQHMAEATVSVLGGEVTGQWPITTSPPDPAAAQWIKDGEPRLAELEKSAGEDKETAAVVVVEQLYRMGEAYWELGRDAEAIACWKRALAVGGNPPRKTTVRHALADSYLQAGDLAGYERIKAELEDAPNFRTMGEAAVRYRNDLTAGWQYLRRFEEVRKQKIADWDLPFPEKADQVIP